MSVREHPSHDSTTRTERATNCTIEDVRVIEGDEFGVDDATVYEVDVVNERGEKRENITIIPSILFESTKDVQHRHQYGIVGKYTRALALQDEDVAEEVCDAIRQKRDEVQERIGELRAKDARLMHTQADLGGMDP